MHLLFDLHTKANYVNRVPLKLKNKKLQKQNEQRDLPPTLHSPDC